LDNFRNKCRLWWYRLPMPLPSPSTILVPGMLSRANESLVLLVIGPFPCRPAWPGHRIPRLIWWRPRQPSLRPPASICSRKRTFSSSTLDGETTRNQNRSRHRRGLSIPHECLFLRRLDHHQFQHQVGRQLLLHYHTQNTPL
jgi:hypothetical protein